MSTFTFDPLLTYFYLRNLSEALYGQTLHTVVLLLLGKNLILLSPQGLLASMLLNRVYVIDMKHVKMPFPCDSHAIFSQEGYRLSYQYRSQILFFCFLF